VTEWQIAEDDLGTVPPLGRYTTHLGYPDQLYNDDQTLL